MSFYDKTLSTNLVEKRNMKSIYDKPTASILNDEILKPLSLISKTRQGALLSLLIFNIILEFLAKASRQE